MAAVEIEGASRLEVVIKNTKPVELTDLTLALLAVGQQYETFVENELPDDIQVSSKLLVKEVRTGSIVFELVAKGLLPTIPLLWVHNQSLAEWCRWAEHLMLYLTGKALRPPKTLTRNDLKQWNNILNPIAKDNGSQMNMHVSDGGTVIQNFFFDSTAANAAQNRIRNEMGEMDEPKDFMHRRCVMTWFQARFDPASQVGNKVVIESISDKPLRVVFDNNAIREGMYAQGSQFGVPWQDLAYFVDVQVQTIDGKPRVVTIMKFYPELTFNPDEQ